MASRPFWSGQLRISLVSIDIQLFPAVNSKADVTFHQIDRKTHQRVHHLNVVNGDKPVADADIVKGFEYSKGKYIVLQPDEIKKVRLRTQKTISISQFVDREELPPYLFEKPYFVAPDPKGASAEAFAVVREAMLEAHKVSIGEVAFGGREHLIAIAPPPEKRYRGMMAYTLRYAEELRNPQTYFSDISEKSIDKKQLALANELIKAQSAPLKLADYRDDYEAAIRKLIEAKRNGSPLSLDKEQPRPKVVSLIDALKRSIEESKPDSTSTKRSAKKGPVLVKSGKRSHRAA